MKSKNILYLVFLALIPSLVFAARPSFTSLQQQINVLNAKVNQLESTGTFYFVDGNGVIIGPVLGMYKYTIPTFPAESLTSTGYIFHINLFHNDLGACRI